MKSIKKIFSLNLLLVFFISCVYGQDANNLDSKIAEYIKPYVDMNAWSGNISIYKDGKAVFQKSYGYADREWKNPNTIDTKFRIASISKLFTEVAILQLTERGQLSLNDKLSYFISDYPRGNEITVQHLLTHRSGITHLNSFPNYNELIKFDYDIKEVVNLFKNKPLDFEPNARYSYSNSGYVLLALIIEMASGLSYASYLNQEIFRPNGLQNTGIDCNESIIEKRAKGYMFDESGTIINAEYVNMDIKIGGGSLYSTTDDLYSFVKSLLRNKILKATLTELPNFSQVDGENIFSVNGRVQGFCHQITHRMDKDLTIIVLGNHYSNIALPIADDLYKIFTNQGYKIPENYLMQQVNIATDILQKYEGSYDFGFGPVGNVKVVNDKLGYRAPGSKKYDYLIPLGNNKFFYIQSWVLLNFKDKSEDNFKTLEWIMGENSYPAKRIKGN